MNLLEFQCLIYEMIGNEKPETAEDLESIVDLIHQNIETAAFDYVLDSNGLLEEYEAQY